MFSIIPACNCMASLFRDLYLYNRIYLFIYASLTMWGAMGQQVQYSETYLLYIVNDCVCGCAMLILHTILTHVWMITFC